jgi:hypothetical protein
VTVPALNVDKLAAKLSGLRFAPRTRIGVRAGFGSPGSITSGSVMGGSGASPGFSIGGAGSGTGGKSPGGTPGLGAGGLGTCCAWSASNFSKTKVLSLRAAHGAVVAFAGDAPANAFSPGGFRRARVTWPSSRVAFRGRSGLFVDAADALHVADIERVLVARHAPDLFPKANATAPLALRLVYSPRATRSISGLPRCPADCRRAKS